AGWDADTRAFWQHRVKEMDALLKDIQAELDALRVADKNLLGQCQLLTSIPGIGEHTALRLLAEIPDIRNFRSAKQLAAFAGLTPANRSSGKSVRKRPRLSKRGRSGLRKILFMPALTARRRKGPLRAFSEQLIERGKPKLAVIGALMRKLLHCVYGVLVSGLPFDPDKAATAHQIA